MTRTDTEDYKHLFLHDIPLIDTRAPVEFKKGSFPMSVNLPLMTDDERHQVGIRYKQAGQEAAIQLGSELVTPSLREQRTANWLEFAKTNPEGYLYCFRGGLRSRITQQWMEDAGINYPYVVGGYKKLRRYLIDSFAENLSHTPLIVLSGRTGTGKTILLNQMTQMIDLEGCAEHRGSSFGSMTTAQPEPIDFDNRLAIALLKLNDRYPKQPVFVEGEGRLIGRLCLPEVLWDKMQDSSVVILDSPIQDRIKIGVDDYVLDILNQLKRIMPEEQAFETFAERHRHSLFRIRKRLGGTRYEAACSLLDSAFKHHHSSDPYDNYAEFIELLLNDYYDPMYDYQLSQKSSEILFRGNSDEILDWSHNYLSQF